MSDHLSRRKMMRDSTLALLGVGAQVQCGLSGQGCRSAMSAPPSTKQNEAPSRVPQGRHATHDKTMRVQLLPPQQAASPLLPTPHGLAHLGATSLSLWDVGRNKEHLHVPLDRPFGLGLLADGSLIALEAPAALRGDARLHRVTSATGPAVAYQGFVSAPAQIRARVLPAAAAAEFLIASPSSHYALERYHLYAANDVRIEESLPLSGDDHATLIGLPGGTALFHREGVLVKLSSPNNRVEHKLPATITGVTHLAAGGSPDQVWVGHGSALSLLRLGEPGGTATVLQTYAARSGQVFHLSSAGPELAALLLEQTAGGSIRKWTLVLLDGHAQEKWQRPLEDAARPLDRFVALGPGYVAVSGSDSLALWDAASGRALR